MYKKTFSLAIIAVFLLAMVAAVASVQVQPVKAQNNVMDLTISCDETTTFQHDEYLGIWVNCVGGYLWWRRLSI
jgi:hypothetical protein